MGVYLGGLDIGMSKHRLNCIDVRAKFQLERCIRMSALMEGDSLCKGKQIEED